MNEIDNNNLSLTSKIPTCNLLFGDINLSISVEYFFRMWNYINLNSWLEHHWFSVNQDMLRVGKRRKLRECFKFHRKWKKFVFRVVIFLPISTSFWISLKGYFQRINEGFK